MPYSEPSARQPLASVTASSLAVPEPLPCTTARVGSAAQTKPLLVVVNHYDQRSQDNLHCLLASLAARPAGVAFDVCVVVNQANGHAPVIDSPHIQFLHCRKNLGMNIGAWDYGWRAHPDYEYYLFLQDECVLLADNWGDRLIEALKVDGIGLVGESINNKWNKPWGELRKKKNSVSPLPGHILNGERANRIDVYLDFMQRHGIDAGVTGRHMRSLVWGFRGATLLTMDGFPTGNNYGECIAAEIAVSKKVEAMGLQVKQLAEESFTAFRHEEWNGHSKKTAKPNSNKRRVKKLLRRLGLRK